MAPPRVLWFGAAVVAAVAAAVAVALLAGGVFRGAGAAENAPARRDGLPVEPRIVAMSPGIAVTLRDLGVADRIVGRHAFDMVLPGSVPVCGDERELDYESLIRVRPTHVLVQAGRRAIPERLATLASERGWTVERLDLLTLDDVRASASRFAHQFCAEPARAADLEARMAAAWSRRAGGFDKAGRILILAAVSPSSALGPGSWHHQILERIGGTPAITEGDPYITLDAEDVLRIAPDGIVLVLPRSPGAAPGPPPPVDELKSLLGRVGTLDIPAVRSGRVALIDDPLAHTPSTAMIGLADELARILEGWSR